MKLSQFAPINADQTSFRITPIKEHITGLYTYRVESQTYNAYERKSTFSNESFAGEPAPLPRQVTLIDSLFDKYYKRTHEMPSSVEKHDITRVQESYEADIAVMKKAVEEHRASIMESCREIARLSCRIQQKQDFIIASASLTAPIRSLPIEVLNIIFSMCLDEYEHMIGRDVAPLLLCQVCKTWRDIAINQSSLWDSPGFTINSRVANLQNLVQMVASNARKRPLTLELWDKIDDRYPFQLPAFTKENMESISSTFMRCVGLGMNVISSESYEALASFQPADFSFPELQQLNMLLCARNIGDTLNKRVTLFNNCPKLTRLSLDLQNPISLFKIILPFRRLFDFNLRLVLPDDNNQVKNTIYWWKVYISRCKKLKTCAVEFLQKQKPIYIGDNLPPSPNHKTIFCNLVTLDIYNGISGNVDQLLEGLMLYNLEEFRFTGVRPCQILLQDNDHTGGPDIQGAYLHLDKIIGLLSYTRLLHRLALVRVSIEDKALRSLLSSLPPNLFHLEIYNLQVRGEEARIQTIDDDSKIIQLLLENTADEPTDSDKVLVPGLLVLGLWYPRHQLFGTPEPLDSHDSHEVRTNYYAELVAKRAKMNRSRNWSTTEDEHFVFELNSLRGHHSEQMISSVAQKIQATSTKELLITVNTTSLDSYGWTGETRRDIRNLIYS